MMPIEPTTELRRRALHMLMGAAAIAALRHTSAARAMDAMAMDGVHLPEGEHDHHHHVMPDGIRRSAANYRVPSVTLVRQDGVGTPFPQEIDGGQTVVLEFMYTSCTAVCPITSQILSQFQDETTADRDKLRIVSISIDPEYDTPARLTEFAKKFHAGRQWQHYTGTVEASIAMQRAFDAYRGDKMNHIPVTFLRAAPGKPWTRFEGFASATELVQEYHRLVMSA